MGLLSLLLLLLLTPPFFLEHEDGRHARRGNGIRALRVPGGHGLADATDVVRHDRDGAEAEAHLGTLADTLGRAILRDARSGGADGGDAAYGEKSGGDDDDAENGS